MWLDIRCPPCCSITPLFSRTSKEKLKRKNKKKTKLVGQDKVSLIKKSKGHVGKQTKTKYFFSTSSQEAMSDQFLRSRASVQLAVAPFS